jgi:glycosyltransferase involved in cell wall biosynthesis
METNSEKPKLSVIIPAYNEAESITGVINGLKKELDLLGLEYEIIAVNDGSSDKSKGILEKVAGIKLINHPYNKGYGASLKTGAKNAKFGWLLFFDADGQHRPEYIKEFLKYTDEYDMIVGWRQGYQGPAVRQPGKKLLCLVANYLAERKIPDLNCGFRLLKKDLFARYEHLFPNGFSLSTTSTLAFMKESLNIKYVPIVISKRNGKSCLKTSDGFKTIMLIIRLIMLFSPLKIFLPIALAGFIISLSMIFYIMIKTSFETFSRSGGFVFVASLLVFLFGLLADQIAFIRREIKK